MPYKRINGNTAARMLILGSGMSQQKFADVLGKSSRYASVYISRDVCPSADKLAEFARICGWQLQLVKDGEVVVIDPAA